MIRIKKSTIYYTVKKYTHSRIIIFRHAVKLRLVTVKIQWKERNYVTDIFDLPEEYIRWIYLGE